MDPATIVAGIGAISSLFGGNSAAKEANRLKQRQLDLQDRALTNYEKYAAVGQGYRDTGSPYLAKQGSVYDTLGTYGMGDRENAIGMLNQLLPQYANNAGVSGLNVNFGTPQTQGTGGANVGNRTPAGTGGAAAALNRNYNGGNVPTATQTAQPAQAAQGGAQSSSPYALSLPQEEQLNQKVDALNREADNAIQEYRASLAQQGLPPNPAGEARIRESLGGLVNQERTNAANSAYAERQKALQSLISLAMGEKASGTDLLGQQASGYGNVAQGYNSYANSATQTGEGGPYLQIAGMNQQGSQFNTQRSDSMYEALGQLLPIIAEAFGGKKQTSYADFGQGGGW